MPRPPKSARRDSRAALLKAAAAEFSARGYDAAGVDRIASRARVTKAMVYYHFRNKLELYREVLRDGARHTVARVSAAANESRPGIDRLEAYVRALLAAAAERPHMTPMLMREIAGGGSHLDAATLQVITQLFQVVRRILDDGRARGEFRETNPLLMHLLITGSSLFYLANEPIRTRVRQLQVLGPAIDVPSGLEPFTEHLVTMLRRTLCKDGPDARD